MSLPRAELLALDLPVAGALEAAFNSAWIGKLVLIAGLCGLLTTWNAILFAGTRLVFALGRGHMIPPVFARVHPRYGSPFIAILFVGSIMSHSERQTTEFPRSGSCCWCGRRSAVCSGCLPIRYAGK